MNWESRQVSSNNTFILICHNIPRAGVLLDKAQDLLKKAPLTEDDRLRRFTIAVNDALSKGLTAFHDAGFDPASLAFFKRYVPLFQSLDID